MDFIARLPHTRSQHDSIWIIVYRLKKSTHFLPVKVTYSAEDYAKLYLKEIMRFHGSPCLSFWIEVLNLPPTFGKLSKVVLVRR